MGPHLTELLDKSEDELRKMLERPPSSGGGGHEGLYVTHTVGPTITHRDATYTEQAKAELIVEWFEKRFPDSDDWAVEEWSHWAVGWVRHLVMRVFHPDHPGRPSEHLQAYHEFVDWCGEEGDDEVRMKRKEVIRDDFFSTDCSSSRLPAIRAVMGWEFQLFDWMWAHMRYKLVDEESDKGVFIDDVEMEEALFSAGLLPKGARCYHGNTLCSQESADVQWVGWTEVADEIWHIILVQEVNDDGPTKYEAEIYVVPLDVVPRIIKTAAEKVCNNDADIAAWIAREGLIPFVWSAYGADVDEAVSAVRKVGEEICADPKRNTELMHAPCENYEDPRTGEEWSLWSEMMARLYKRAWG